MQQISCGLFQAVIYSSSHERHRLDARPAARDAVSGLRLYLARVSQTVLVLEMHVK